MTIKELSSKINVDPFILTQDLRKRGYKVISPKSEITEKERVEIEIIYQKGFSPLKQYSFDEAKLIPLTKEELEVKSDLNSGAKEAKDAGDIINALYAISTPFPEIALDLIQKANAAKKKNKK